MDMKQFEIQENEKPLDIIKENCGFASIFKTMGVIGDSLSSGEFEAIDENGCTTYHDMYEYSWPAILSRICGTEYHNYSRGGMSAQEYYDSWADQNHFWEKRQGYIIRLGTNDIFVYHHPVGSADDVDPSHPEHNPKTYFGYLGKIISKLKTLEKDARIFVVSLQLDHSSQESDDIIRYVNEELKKLVQKFTYTYHIDMTTYSPAYDEKAREKYAMGYHPNAIGYYMYALMIGNYIDYIIRQNYRDFFELPFVGTDLKYYR